jgi:hypothetical protein
MKYLQYSLFSFTIFFEILGEIIFETFNISQNNIISVELAKVLIRYIIFQKVRGRLGICKIPTYWCVRLGSSICKDLKKTLSKELKRTHVPPKENDKRSFLVIHKLISELCGSSLVNGS